MLFLMCDLVTVVHTVSVWIRVSTVHHPPPTPFKPPCSSSCCCVSSHLARPIALVSLCSVPCGAAHSSAARPSQIAACRFDISSVTSVGHSRVCACMKTHWCVQDLIVLITCTCTRSCAEFSFDVESVATAEQTNPD